MHCNKVSFQELLDNDFGNNLEHNTENSQRNIVYYTSLHSFPYKYSPTDIYVNGTVFVCGREEVTEIPT